MSAAGHGTRRRFLTTAAAASLAGCSRRDETPSHGASATRPKWLLTPGAPPPDWGRLEAWQGTVTRDDFVRLLEDVLTDGKSWFRHIEVRDDRALIRPSTPDESAARVELRFAARGAGEPRGARYWRRAEELPPLKSDAAPLSDVHVALDPGHIGGVWAPMEQRWFRRGSQPPVKEGELTLRTAEILAPMLEALGARVSFVRRRLEPASKVKPGQLRNEARASLRQEGMADPNDDQIRRESERLFYRAAEIRARAARVNDELRPDVVLCLHFNADGWGGEPEMPVFSLRNHLHLIAHGCLDPAEFDLDDQRLDGLLRLVQRIPDTELPLNAAIARSMAAATGLPAYAYHGRSARPMPGEPYVWIRNLLANRLYRCPTVYLEPYVMNNQEVFDRIMAGDYAGESIIAGVRRKSIYREYAGGVTDGMAAWFRERRRA